MQNCQKLSEQIFKYIKKGLIATASALKACNTYVENVRNM